MQKSELLYGLHLAINAMREIYVVEGPADAWRVGPGAVALFGKDLSQTQKLLLVHHFIGRRIVVMLDQDAHEEALKIQHDLRLAREQRQRSPDRHPTAGPQGPGRLYPRGDR